MGEEKIHYRVCFIFITFISFFLQVETGGGYSYLVVILRPLRLWLISLVFHPELNGFSLFLDEKKMVSLLSFQIGEETSPSIEGIKPQ